MEPAPQANLDAVRAYREHVRVMAELLLAQVQSRLWALSHLRPLRPQHPDAFIFESLPGAGALLAPALLVKFGDHRDRFPSASIDTANVARNTHTLRRFRLPIGHGRT